MVPAVGVGHGNGGWITKGESSMDELLSGCLSLCVGDLYVAYYC